MVMAEEMERRLLSVKEACFYLHLSRTTLYHMIERKEILPVVIGGRTLFDKNDLDELIENVKAVGGGLVRKRGRQRSLEKEKKSFRKPRGNRKK